MDNQQAAGVLNLLARGVDPTTGELLSQDGPLAEAEVILALNLGVRALEQAVPATKPGFVSLIPDELRLDPPDD